MMKESTAILHKMQDSETMASRLDQALRLRRMNKLQLAHLSGVSYRQVINIIGHNMAPRSDTLEKLAAVLNVSSGWLKTGENEPAVVRETPPAYGAVYPITEDETQGMRGAIEAIAKQTGLSREEVLNSVCDAMKRKVLGDSKAG